MARVTRTGRVLLAGGAVAAAATAIRAARRGPAIHLQGRVALVTGGSRGLGLLVAAELVDAGCRVAICARDERELQAALAILRRPGAHVAAFRCDIADRDQVERMVAEVERELGPVELLVNNAGVIQVGPLASLSMDDFREAMEINYWGTVHTSLAVLPSMRRRRSGRIANVTSIGGRVAIPHLLPYSASKFAAVGFSEGLRAEVAADGIRVTTVVPGLMRTGSPVNAFFRGDVEKEFAWFSLGDATPISAMSARRAARRIVDALRHGDAQVTLSWQAAALRLTHDLLPGLTSDLMAMVDRLLPSGDGVTERVRGMKLATPLSPSPLTAMMNRAARRNNQYGGGPLPSAEHARQVGLGGNRGNGVHGIDSNGRPE